MGRVSSKGRHQEMPPRIVRPHQESQRIFRASSTIGKNLKESSSIIKNPRESSGIQSGILATRLRPPLPYQPNAPGTSLKASSGAVPIDRDARMLQDDARMLSRTNVATYVSRGCRRGELLRRPMGPMGDATLPIFHRGGMQLFRFHFPRRRSRPIPPFSLSSIHLFIYL